MEQRVLQVVVARVVVGDGGAALPVDRERDVLPDAGRGVDQGRVGPVAAGRTGGVPEVVTVRVVIREVGGVAGVGRDAAERGMHLRRADDAGADAEAVGPDAGVLAGEAEEVPAGGQGERARAGIEVVDAAAGRVKQLDIVQAATGHVQDDLAAPGEVEFEVIVVVGDQAQVAERRRSLADGNRRRAGRRVVFLEVVVEPRVRHGDRVLDVESLVSQPGRRAALVVAVAVVLPAQAEDLHDPVGGERRVDLLEQRGHRGRVRRGEARPGRGDVDVAAARLVPVGEGKVLAGREEVEVVAALGELGDDVVVVDRADRVDAGMGGGVVDAAAHATVAGDGGHEDPGRMQRGELVPEWLEGDGARVVSVAEGHVDGDDVVLGAVGDHPLEGALDRAVAGDAQRDELRVGREPAVALAVEDVLVRGDHACDAGPVAVRVDRVVVVVDEVVAGDHLIAGSEPAAERGVGVPDAGVDDDNRLAFAGDVRVPRGGVIEVDQLGEIAPRLAGEQFSAFQMLKTDASTHQISHPGLPRVATTMEPQIPS